MTFVNTNDIRFHVWISRRGIRYTFSRTEKPFGKESLKVKYLGHIVDRDSEKQTITLNTGRVIFKMQPNKKPN